MAQVNEIEIEGESVRVCVQSVVEKMLNTKNVKIHVEPGSKKGDNFIGIVYRILYGKSTDHEKECKSFILKVAPLNEIRREQSCTRNFFLREIYMYSEVISWNNLKYRDKCDEFL